MLSDTEIRSIYSGLTKRDMTFEEFSKQVKAQFDLKRNAADLNEMVESRMRYSAGVREKKRIEKALKQQKVSID